MNSRPGPPVIPHFLICGAQKGGTTWLYDVLRRLKGFQPSSSAKELRLLMWNWPAKWDVMPDADVLVEYQSHWRRPVQGLTFEATPGYIAYPKTAERVKRLRLNNRFIVTLREPVSRMESVHKMLVRDRGVEADFAKYFAGAIELFRAEIAKDPDDDMTWYRRCIDHPDQRLRAIARTLYVLQLRYWHSLFPQESFFLTRTQDLNDPQEIMRIVRFCGNHNTTMEEICAVMRLPIPNKSVQPRYPQEVMQPFAEFFAPYTQALYDEFGVDLRQS